MISNFLYPAGHIFHGSAGCLCLDVGTGKELALLPWPVDQLNHGTESFGHALVLITFA